MTRVCLDLLSLVNSLHTLVNILTLRVWQYWSMQDAGGCRRGLWLKLNHKILTNNKYLVIKEQQEFFTLLLLLLFFLYGEGFFILNIFCIWSYKCFVFYEVWIGYSEPALPLAVTDFTQNILLHFLHLEIFWCILNNQIYFYLAPHLSVSASCAVEVSTKFCESIHNIICWIKSLLDLEPPSC